MKRFLIGLSAAFAIVLGGAAIAQSVGDATFGTVRIGTGTKTATATAGAATLANVSGKVTSEALVTASGADYTLTLTNTRIAATDQVYASVAYGTATTGVPTIARIQPAAGSVVIVVRNLGAAALNGTIVVSFFAVRT